MADDQRSPHDDDTSLSADHIPSGQQAGSDIIGKRFKVPEDMINAGHDTDDARNDSPESLDEVL